VPPLGETASLWLGDLLRSAPPADWDTVTSEWDPPALGRPPGPLPPRIGGLLGDSWAAGDPIPDQSRGFWWVYNQHRPHRYPGQTTPTVAYTRLPKAIPAGQPASHYRIRQDIIGDNGVITLRHAGKLHHIRCLATSQGALGRIRTCDTRFRKPVLYPLSYEGRCEV
jgi:hypothetical protein